MSPRSCPKQLFSTIFTLTAIWVLVPAALLLFWLKFYFSGCHYCSDSDRSLHPSSLFLCIHSFPGSTLLLATQFFWIDLFFSWIHSSLNWVMAPLFSWLHPSPATIRTPVSTLCTLHLLYFILVELFCHQMSVLHPVLDFCHRDPYLFVPCCYSSSQRCCGLPLGHLPTGFK